MTRANTRRSSWRCQVTLIAFEFLIGSDKDIVQEATSSNQSVETEYKAIALAKKTL